MKTITALHDLLAPYRKAIVAALAIAANGLFVALGDDVVTPAEWASIAAGVFGGGGVAWAIPNRARATPDA